MQDRVTHIRQPVDSARIIAALGEGNIAFAEDRVRDLLTAHPDDVNAQYLFGLVQLVKGEAADSISWLEKAHRRQPDNTVYRANLGVACLRAGRLAGACQQHDQGGCDCLSHGVTSAVVACRALPGIGLRVLRVIPGCRLWCPA